MSLIERAHKRLAEHKARQEEAAKRLNYTTKQATLAHIRNVLELTPEELEKVELVPLRELGAGVFKFYYEDLWFLTGPYYDRTVGVRRLLYVKTSNVTRVQWNPPAAAYWNNWAPPGFTSIHSLVDLALEFPNE